MDLEFLEILALQVGRDVRGAAQTTDRVARVGVCVVIQAVNLAVFPIAHQVFVGERDAAIGAVAVVRGRWAVPIQPFVPLLRGQVINPGDVGVGECDDVKLVALDLVRPGAGVGHVNAHQAVFDSVRGQAFVFVALHDADGGCAQRVAGQKHERISVTGHRKSGPAAVLRRCAGHALKRECQQTGNLAAHVHPNFGGDFAQQVHLAVVNDQRHDGVRRSVLCAEPGLRGQRVIQVGR